ncbi:hypothetical protein [Paenibacillus sp. YYML68]|uniref:hypothetical protein n=1 Tax=Paenibacillus sp. YYML68 TaxID=2909250 RepID=UPI0024905D30|nr:hypothetical protein [Paenibacillus sp. YYML68]
MDKKTYYVAVSAGTGQIVEPEQMNGNFEFEILATNEEIEKLSELFEDKEKEEEDSAVRALTPYRLYHNDKENDAYDETLLDIYSMLHELGTPATRKHIESMGILAEGKIH